MATGFPPVGQSCHADILRFGLVIATNLSWIHWKTCCLRRRHWGDVLSSQLLNKGHEFSPW